MCMVNAGKVNGASAVGKYVIKIAHDFSPDYIGSLDFVLNLANIMYSPRQKG